MVVMPESARSGSFAIAERHVPSRRECAGVQLANHLARQLDSSGQTNVPSESARDRSPRKGRTVLPAGNVTRDRQGHRHQAHSDNASLPRHRRPAPNSSRRPPGPAGRRACCPRLRSAAQFAEVPAPTPGSALSHPAVLRRPRGTASVSRSSVEPAWVSSSRLCRDNAGLCDSKLTIEYAGTRYSGWQIQKNARTVQGEIERAVHDATGYATSSSTDRVEPTQACTPSPRSRISTSTPRSPRRCSGGHQRRASARYQYPAGREGAPQVPRASRRESPQLHLSRVAPAGPRSQSHLSGG